MSPPLIPLSWLPIKAPLTKTSVLAVREIKEFTDIPILQSMEKDYKKIYSIVGA